MTRSDIALRMRARLKFCLAALLLWVSALASTGTPEPTDNQLKCLLIFAGKRIGTSRISNAGRVRWVTDLGLLFEGYLQGPSWPSHPPRLLGSVTQRARAPFVFARFLNAGNRLVTLDTLNHVELWDATIGDPLAEATLPADRYWKRFGVSGPDLVVIDERNHTTTLKDFLR